MSEKDSVFFNENISRVNKTIEMILLTSALVPVSFIILSIIKIWIVPHDYSIKLLVFCLVSYGTCHMFNKFPRYQNISMYTGLTCCTIFVIFLGVNSVISVTIAYGFVPFLSCLYYNRRLTQGITLINYVSLMISLYVRSGGVQDVYIYKALVQRTSFEWFISNSIGFTIEFFFLFLITTALSNKTRITLKQLIRTMEENEKAMELVNEKNRLVSITNAELEEKNNRLSETQEKIIGFVAEVLGSHDLFTGHHAIHTRSYVEAIALELKKENLYVEILSDEYIETMKTAALLHDLGKIHIPDRILNKQGRFSPEEFEIMKSHPEEGKKLLEFFPLIDDGRFNEMAMEMAWHHHEKWDGTGYPRGLKGKEIPLCARIMACADVLDALVSRRLYKEPLTFDQAMEIFRTSSGTHFEPCLSRAVIQCRTRLEELDRTFKAKEKLSHDREVEWWTNFHKAFGT